jgi:hypothetical protein
MFFPGNAGHGHRRDARNGSYLPKAEIHVLDAGHCALDTKADEIATLVGDFMK